LRLWINSKKIARLIIIANKHHEQSFFRTHVWRIKRYREKKAAKEVTISENNKICFAIDGKAKEIEE